MGPITKTTRKLCLDQLHEIIWIAYRLPNLARLTFLSLWSWCTLLRDQNKCEARAKRTIFSCYYVQNLSDIFVWLVASIFVYFNCVFIIMSKGLKNRTGLPGLPGSPSEPGMPSGPTFPGGPAFPGGPSVPGGP